MKIYFIILFFLLSSLFCFGIDTIHEIPVELKLRLQNFTAYHQFPSGMKGYKKSTINNFDWGDIIIEVYFNKKLVFSIVDDYKEKYHPIYIQQIYVGVTNIWNKGEYFTFDADVELDEPINIYVKLYTLTCPEYWKRYGPNETINISCSDIAKIRNISDELILELNIDISRGFGSKLIGKGHRTDIRLTNDIYHNPEHVNNKEKVSNEVNDDDDHSPNSVDEIDPNEQSNKVNPKEEKLEEAKKLYDDKLISEDEYKELRKNILGI